MLSEAFLSTVLYQQTLSGESQPDQVSDDRTTQKRYHNSVRQAQESQTKGVNIGGGVSIRREEGRCYQWGSAAPPSQAMYIPCRDLAGDNSLDLYTSWSSTYATIYKNYPDLHIGGDHILNKKDSGCVLDQESEEGPVLLSVDIDSNSPPSEGLGELSLDRVLDSEETSALPSAPFSNSALNGFLEKKMQELYKQCYEDNLVTNTSPSVLLLNINQMSLLISQERNMDQAKAKEAILQYLCSATSGGSSEFITPILHISSQDSKKKSGTLSNCPVLKKNSSVLIRK